MLMCLSNLGSLMAGSFQFAFHQLARCWPECPRRRFRPPAPPSSNVKHHQDSHQTVSTIIPASGVNKPNDEAKDQHKVPLDEGALPSGRARRHSELRRQDRVVISDAELSECDYDTVPGATEQTPPVVKVTPPGEYGLDRLGGEACGVLDLCRRYNSASPGCSANAVGAPRLDPILVEKLLASAAGPSSVPSEQHVSCQMPRGSPVRQVPPAAVLANRKKPVPVVIVLAFLVG